MDKKLEVRIARLEKMLSRKNESTTQFNAAEQKALNKCRVWPREHFKMLLMNVMAL